ncbi:NAD-dependent epimerase/dehydratase family protein [Fredinandcohnia sp. QZ13]|uniref:NAD-dependent epimerase/dehydratase family protein n=1 Tax=Fredinandcohnia sp. QZ13 TaxID=3073144 RepID=UPI00285360A6|nr:NAD-dependent epimerase/dehydratase family protein [Fredinandcohnia sp. QZ13]MDR4886867.1 NAD-dependent epimerase/dehydratase family protein [Fredinandcohnia sp. QZ13]
MKKKIAIIGGTGLIGSILEEGLNNKYEIFILDKKVDNHPKHIEVDATNFEDLTSKIPPDCDALVNLLNVKTKNDFKDLSQFHKKTEIHFLASFYILKAAIDLGIPKVVYASSNHVTDFYEKDGNSILGREITVDDYPYSKSLYGTLKLASENLGHILAYEEENNLSVINLRIGSVRRDEGKDLQTIPRTQKTLLSHQDVIHLFDVAIQSTIKFGTYYGVSDNKDKPWSTENATRELGFSSKMNANDVLERAKTEMDSIHPYYEDLENQNLLN